MRSETSVFDRAPPALVLATAAAVLALGGCASESGGVRFATGSRAQVTPDGLHLLENTRFQQVWLKPDADLSSYADVMIDPARVSYKREPRRRRASTSYGTGNFALSASQMDWLRDGFRDAFVDALAASPTWQVVDEPGADTLKLDPQIIDLVVDVPTQTIGSDRTYTTSTAKMTLLLEVRDSLSNEILARAMDRREARDPAAGLQTLYYSNTVTDSAAMEAVFARWAQILRDGLDEMREVHLAPPEPASPSE